VIEEGGDPNLYTIGIEFEDAGDPLHVVRTDAQYRTGAALIARIARRWGIPVDEEHVIGHREIFAGKDCPGNLDKLRLIAEASPLADAEPGSPPTSERRIACLVPARNAAPDLPGFLDSAAGLADVIVALDDGSTDGSGEILERSPLVGVLLRNPPREGFAGWDDGRNRQRLLEAAGEVDPTWIVFLDADERLDGEDAAALRSFLRSDAIAGCAYGLRLYREWGDGRVAERFTWVYRAFAFAPGQVLPDRRLHFNPVPQAVPRSAWLRTTIRARHLDSPRRLQARVAKYRDADPREEFREVAPRLLEPPGGQLRAWERRPAGLPVLDPSLHLGVTGTRASGDAGLGLACLLPARNCVADLPGFLESAARVADAVIALDDGSTDGTAEALDRSPVVRTLLRNPRRAGYEDWDDAANRQQLLEAAVDCGAAWALFLDADERIDPDDAAALREFVEAQADPGCAYGFRVHRMIGDGAHYDRAGLWVYRLFAPARGQRLPDRRLHLVPIPTSIPRERWRRTTIRIQHLGGVTEERRAARLAKYEAADPRLEWQSDYSGLASGQDPPRPWRARPPGLPVLAEPPVSSGHELVDLESLDLDAPVLSAVVIARDDERTIERSVRSVVEQECPEPFEVIVVVSGSAETARIVREGFPGVRLVELERPVLPGAARNAGLRLARGEYVSFPGSHVELPPGSLAPRVRAHELGYAMVTGSIGNGTLTRSGWASYFLDHSSALPGRPSGELQGAPSHCSYVREFLLEVGGFPEDLRAGEDTVVNQELWRRGHRAYREREIRLVHRSPCTGPLRLVRHHFRRGNAFGRLIRAGRPGVPPPTRRAVASYLRRYPWLRLRDTDHRVGLWGAGLEERYAAVRPLVVLGVVSAWAGAWVGVLSRNRRRVPSASSDQLRQPDEPKAASPQPADDSGQGLDGGFASAAAVVHDDD
jgi:glycosyltransferase involved in cell wall biosynthesis